MIVKIFAGLLNDQRQPHIMSNSIITNLGIILMFIFCISCIMYMIYMDINQLNFRNLISLFANKYYIKHKYSVGDIIGYVVG